MYVAHWSPTWGYVLARGLCGCVCLCVLVCGCVWPWVVVCGYIWPFVAVFGHLRRRCCYQMAMAGMVFLTGKCKLRGLCV